MHDRLGSVRLLIDTAGNVQNRYTYMPFGEMTSECSEAISNPFKFTGQWYDSEIGQYYLRARMYDPYLGRFTSFDPVWGAFEEPLALHKYLYCTNDPINKYDPTGELEAVPIMAQWYAEEATVQMGILAAITAYITWNVYWHNVEISFAASSSTFLNEVAYYLAKSKDYLRGGKQSQRDRYYGYEKQPDFNKFKEWLHKMKEQLFGKKTLTQEEMDEAWEIWKDWGKPKG